MISPPPRNWPRKIFFYIFGGMYSISYGLVLSLIKSSGFGSLLFVASVICFIAWYSKFYLCDVNATHQFLLGNRSENPIPRLPTLPSPLSFSSSSLYKPSSMLGKVFFLLVFFFPVEWC